MLNDINFAGKLLYFSFVEGNPSLEYIRFILENFHIDKVYCKKIQNILSKDYRIKKVGVKFAAEVVCMIQKNYTVRSYNVDSHQTFLSEKIK